ncbi:MAG: hypothetical protein OHK0046_09450 [Anaerolineae bacterium]
MAQNDLRQRLQQGINAIRSGDRETGRQILREVAREDPRNELAWIWLATAASTVTERRAYLERVLQINPQNTRAQEALERLKGRSTDEIPAYNNPPVAAPRPTTPPRRPAQQSRGPSLQSLLIFGGLLVSLLVIALVALQVLNDNDDTPVVVALPTADNSTPTATNTPLPTATIRPFDGTSGAPTLPPSFTPTRTPQPTATATPTATPIPVENFQMLYANLVEGRSQPDLFLVENGGESRIGADVRDMVYDPAGERIAFVRDVTYIEGERTGTFPELFIAPVNAVESAQQITEMRTANVSHPTWSPEGRELVFVADLDGSDDLWYVTPDGQNLRRLTFNDFIDRDPTWEPVLGSRRIVFASDRDSIGSTEIYSLNIGEPDEDLPYQRLTNADASSYAPAWADNGSGIAFISDRGGDPDVYIMRPDGTGQTLLTGGDGGAEDRRPSFTPDGRYVVFISNRLDDRFQTYLISLDGDVLVRLTDNNGSDVSVDFRPELILRLR